MKQRLLRLVLLLFLILGSTIPGKADIIYQFRRISPQGGFSFFPIRATSQDKYGFIWFVTHYNLYQYNTQDFISYSTVSDRNFIHISNTITCFLIDSQNKKWIGTSVGLNLLNDSKGHLEYFPINDPTNPLRVKNIRALKQCRDKEIWLIEGVSLAKLDTIKRELRYVMLNGERLDVNAFCFDSNNNIYAVNNRREIYHINARTFEAKQLNFKHIPGIIHGIYFFQNSIWISSDGEGVVHYDLNGNLLNYFEGKRGLTTDIPSNRVRDVLQTSDGKVWISTYKGLVLFHNNKLSVFRSEFDNPFSIPDNSIMSLYEDRQKGLWIGAWRGGLAYLNEFSNVFEKYQHSPFLNSVSDNIINAIAEDKSGLMWIGTESQGLNTFDPKTKEFALINVKGPNNTSPGNIKRIYRDPDDNIWLGTFRQGLFVRRKGEKEFRQFLLTSENVYDILSDGKGLWIATFNKGLFYYRYSDKSLKTYSIQIGDPNSIRSNQLRTLLLDKTGSLWIITEGGLCRKPASQEWFQPVYIDDKDSEINTRVHTIVSGANGTIWAGTSNGLLHISETQNIKRIPINFNLKNVSVYGIVSVSARELWLGTNTGIFSFNPETGKYQNYSSLDGIPGNLFTPGTACKSVSGQVYFGGTSGLVAFDPSKIRINSYSPKVYLTKFLIDYKEVRPNEKGSPLEKPIYELEKVHLRPTQNSFSIEFVALNYLNPQKNQFRYRLKGFDKDWVESGFISKANYTNLSPGRYVFEVMACNNDGVWNSESTKLSVFVVPPFYKSWPAYLIYAIVLSLLGWSVWRFVLFRARMVRQVEMERLKRIQEEEMHQVKLDFYTNISHELRTPLTLITGPLETLQTSERLNERERDMLSLIKRNSTRLLRLINQLLEFRKLEFGKKELLVNEMDVNSFVQELLDCFNDIAKQKKINFTFTSLQDHLIATFDAEKLDKIIFNIISNAFKNTPERGTILVEVSSGKKYQKLNGQTGFLVGELISDNFIQISVEDNGVGIEPDQVPKIFERFYQIDGGAGSGSGIGLHLVKQLVLMHGGEIELQTTPGKGCVFIVRIPHNLASFQKLKNHLGVHVNATPNDSSGGKITETSDLADFSDENDKNTEKNRKSDTLILVVEDNNDLKKFITQILTDNYRIITAEDGREGLQKAQLYLPDMIISDVLMPNMNGVEFCRELKSDINTSHIPVIMLTALTSSKNKIEGLSSGADAYIEKPFDSKVLLAQIESIFKARERLQKKISTSLAGNLMNDVPETLDQKLLFKAIRYVEEFITNENLDIENLAGFLNMSRSSLHRKLKALTNKSASDFIRTIRLERAARLMKEGHHNIDEVSVMTGFNSHSYFTRAFKDHFAKTPSEFIAAHQN